MADERVFFEERVELREFGAPGQVRRRIAVPFLGDRPAFEPTHVRVTDRHVQVGDRTILLARVSDATWSTQASIGSQGHRSGAVACCVSWQAPS